MTSWAAIADPQQDSRRGARLLRRRARSRHRKRIAPDSQSGRRERFRVPPGRPLRRRSRPNLQTRRSSPCSSSGWTAICAAGITISFNQQGYAAVRFTEYREDYHHQHQNVRTENGIEYGDVPKCVNFDYVANVARINAATLASLASAPAPPAKVRLQTKELENNSTHHLGGLTGAALPTKCCGAPPPARNGNIRSLLEM